MHNFLPILAKVMQCKLVWFHWSLNVGQWKTSVIRWEGFKNVLLPSQFSFLFANGTEKVWKIFILFISTYLYFFPFWDMHTVSYHDSVMFSICSVSLRPWVYVFHLISLIPHELNLLENTYFQEYVTYLVIFHTLSYIVCISCMIF